MTSSSSPRRRPSVHITLNRAARFYRLVNYLGALPRTRPDILAHLKIGLRTFYRELDLLRRCGVRIRHRKKYYHLLTTAADATGRLPFPDPQLSFAEMAELAACDCPAGHRLAEMLASVVQPAEPAAGVRRVRSSKSGRSSSRKPKAGTPGA
jgi:predicted DNA-binding transcriptional regulator YafY